MRERPRRDLHTCCQKQGVAACDAIHCFMITNAPGRLLPALAPTRVSEHVICIMKKVHRTPGPGRYMEHGASHVQLPVSCNDNAVHKSSIVDQIS